MEKTVARALYKEMALGQEYSTQEIIEIAKKLWLPSNEEQDLKKAINKALWKIVNSGYAITQKRQVEMSWIRGCQFGGTKVVKQEYTIRYWIRIK